MVLEILSWVLFGFAILLNIINFLFISHHGYIVKKFKQPKRIRQTEIKRYSKYIISIAIAITTLLLTAFLLNQDIGVYIFGSFLLKFSIHLFFWIQGFLFTKKIKLQKAST